MKKLACKDLDPNIACDFMVEGETDEEVVEKMKEHARVSHPEKMQEMSEEEMEEKMKMEIKEDW